MTVKGKNRNFIDVSREARVLRNLHLLERRLDSLVQLGQSPEERSLRSQSLRMLDQGLGDLLRIVKAGSASGARTPRVRSRAGVSPAAGSSSSNKGGE